MSKDSADRIIVIGAAITGGLYAWEKWRGVAKTPVTEFMTGCGIAWLLLSLLAEASPGIGGGLALLATVSDVLMNPKLWTELASAAQNAGKGPGASKKGGVFQGQGAAAAAPASAVLGAPSTADQSLTVGQIVGLGPAALDPGNQGIFPGF